MHLFVLLTFTRFSCSMQLNALICLDVLVLDYFCFFEHANELIHV